MKSIRTSYSKEIRALLQDDREFRESTLMRHARALVDFVIESAESGKLRWPLVPVDSIDQVFRGADRFHLLHERYPSTARIESYFFPGVAGASVGVNIFFYPHGNKVDPILGLTGGVDSQAIRKLKFVRT
jgi:hypothetical protein